jgi:hypothetical protein
VPPVATVPAAASERARELLARGIPDAWPTA